MVNVEVNSNQYNSFSMYHEAQTIGMNLDDLNEFGFEKSALENAENNYRGIDQKFDQFLMQESAFSCCYPLLQKNFNPVITFIWGLKPVLFHKNI